MEITVDGVVYRTFDHLYAVSETGDVIRNLAVAKLCIRKDGYLTAGRQRLVHRMVATCWLEKPEGSHHVHHMNENKRDNRACNLVWVTPKQHLGGYHESPMKGRAQPDTVRQKIREARLGTKSSDETRQKIREYNLRTGHKPPSPVVGTKLSDEHRAAISRNHGKKCSCVVNGVAYVSFKEAGNALGERPLTLRKRCLSPNFPDYQLSGK